MTDHGGDLREFERSLPMALMRARESVMRYFRPSLDDHELTEQQWRVLRALNGSDQALSVGELAGRTNLLGPSLSRMLVGLDERGLVRRQPGADDARRAEVSITDAGVTLVATIAPTSEARYRQIEAELGNADLEHLYRLLEKVASLEGPVDIADADQP
ncbi:MAG: homoprotocatechuate degradation operon regulator HpaR [Acidimicrobiales bacterium]